MGYLNLRPEQSNIFFKLMEERYGKKTTIITTNLDYDQWYRRPLAAHPSRLTDPQQGILGCPGTTQLETKS